MMGNGPAPFSEIGKSVRDLFTKGYQYDKKISLSVPWVTLTFKEGKSNADTQTRVSTNIPGSDGKHLKTDMKFDIPDFSSGKVGVQYLHPRVAIGSSIGLNLSPMVDFSATVGNKNLHCGGEVEFDVASDSITKYTAGISFKAAKDCPTFALLLMDKGKTLTFSSLYSINSRNLLFCELTHRLPSAESGANFGSAHIIDRYNKVKTKFVDFGKVAMVWQRELLPKSSVSVSVEYSILNPKVYPKWGLSLALGL